MSSHPSWYNTLVEAARSRGVDVSFVDIKNLSAQSAAELESWVNETFSKEKVLTAEEFKLSKYLEKNKRSFKPVADGQDDFRSAPLTEQALEDAIQVLETSTQSVQGRIHALKQLNQTVTSSHETPKSSAVPSDSFGIKLQKQKEAERQQLFFMNTETDSELQQAIRSNQEKLDRCLNTVSTLVKEKLKSDDRLLDSLDPTAPSTALQDLLKSSKSSVLLDVLRRAIVQSIKARLDRVYLNELQTLHHNSAEAVSSEDLKQARSNLQLLYSDIEDVASMVVDNQYGSSIKAMEKELADLADEAATKHAINVKSKLEALTGKANQLATRYELLQGHRIICSEISQLYQQAQCANSTVQDLQPAQQPVPKHNNEQLHNLLRHLNISTSDTVKFSDMSQLLLNNSDSISKDNRSLANSILKDVQRSTEQSEARLQRLSAISNTDLSEAAQQNKALDDQIAAAKTQLEDISKKSDVTAEATRFVERSRGGLR